MPRRRAVIGLLIALPLLLVSLLPARPAAAELPWRDKGSPFGMVTAVGNRVRADEIDAYVGLLREAGVQWAREEFFWHIIQPEPGGPFQWGGDASGLYNYDRAVGAQASAGIQILGMLDYAPAWNYGNPPLDAWIKEWGDYV